MQPQGKCLSCSKAIKASVKYCVVCRTKNKTDQLTKKLDLDQKVCPRCKRTKSTKDFFFNKKRMDWSGYCKSCYSDDVASRQVAFKKKCVEYKGGKCIVCGYDKCLAALDFHHRDPKEKDFGISQFRCVSFEKNKERVTKELDKCDLVCANCHREIHSK
jgi:hypothetical protein